MGPEPLKKTLRIRSGTDMARCHGYCDTELYLDSTTAVFVERSILFEKFPERSERVEITAAEWNDLAHAADTSGIMKLDSTIGCPGCADGGIEWIEVRSVEGTKQVVFPLGAEVPAIADLLEKIRAIRKRFTE